MKIKGFIGLSLFLCLVQWCWASKEGGSGIDTTWVVNYQYSAAEYDTFDYTFTLPGRTGEMQKYNFVRVVWGTRGADGQNEISAVQPYGDEEISLGTHTYPSGIYYLIIDYYVAKPDETSYIPGDKQSCQVIFNQDLMGSITIEEGVSGCMEKGVDTFLIRLHDHELNPKGTTYSVQVQTLAPVQGDKLWISFPSSQDITDSVYVVFLEPTGTFGAMVQVNMTYKEEESSRYSKFGSTEARKIYVYKKPDLLDMFHYADTLKDEFKDYPYQYLEVCTGNELEDMKYDSLRNIKYAYADGLPVYKERYNFNVEYFRKDSVNQLDWQNVTRDSVKVDTVDMIFKYPGFYKIEMTAENACGSSFLSTEDLVATTKKQLIKVYQSGKNSFDCKDDKICGISAEGTVITFMDYGTRLGWDASPQYNFLILRTYKEVTDTVKLINSLEITCYKNGIAYDTLQASTIGCDSTKLQFKLYQLGSYQITASRTNHCGSPLLYTHTVEIGDVPVLPADTLWAQLGATPEDPFHYCGEYTYTFPQIDIDNQIFEVDSIGWYFGKKSRWDTVYQDVTTTQQYLFDSLGDHKNYIYLKARNYCGWSQEEKTELYTDLIPHVSLWRDSLEKNDSLCLGVDYQYHWVGDMPEHYSVRGIWAGEVKVNGAVIPIGNDAIMASTEGGLPRIGKVKYNQSSNQIYEYFQVWNTNNPACLQEIKDSLVVVSPPEGILYKDTIWHCEDFMTLQTKSLFETENPDFKYVDWKLNDELMVRDLASDFDRSLTLNGNQEDSLYMVIYNSKGCYKDNKLFFIPVEKPALTLKYKNLEKCAEVVLESSDYTSPFIQDFNGRTNPDIYLNVYQDQVDPYHLIYDLTQDVKVKKNLELNFQSGDTVRLIYEAKNKKVTSGFGDCMIRDTMALKVWKPLLEIVGKDTIRGLDISKYELKKSGITHQIDTADLKDQKIAWTLLDEGGNQNLGNALEMNYILTEHDKQKDSLQFELSGRSVCGMEMKDTLVVYLPRERLQASADTICSTDTGYLLWDPEHGKTSGVFINPATLIWTLLPDKNGITLGHLTGSVGDQVKYIPATDAWKADTVKIEVRGWNQYDVSQTGRTLIDTLFLKVNKAVRNIYPDTLYLKAAEEDGRVLVVDDIRMYKSGVTGIGDANSAAISWKWAGDGGMNASFENGKFYLGLPYDENNYTSNFTVELQGLKGCANVQSRVIICGVMPPQVNMNSFDLCDGGSVRVDTGYQVKGKDGFLRLRWSAPDGNGRFINSAGQLQYQAGVADPVTEFKLEASKAFTLYDGTLAEYQASVNGSVHLYRKPRFHLEDGQGNEITHDTLCIDEDVYTYKRDWIAGENYSEANFTMANMVAIHSTGLTGDFPEFTLQEGTVNARLIVTADLGTCKKWENIGDTIYITKLSAMTGSFHVPAVVCEGHKIEVTQVVADPLCKNLSWTSTGGILDQSNIKQPEYIAAIPGKGSLSMLVTPPHGCLPVETFTKEFDILEKPVLLLRDTVICEEGQVTFNFMRGPLVKSITWKVNGSDVKVTTTESEFTYHYRAGDVVDGKIRIVGEITPEYPCSDKILSNEMVITVQKRPLISGSLNAEMCQGDSLILTPDIVSVTNPESIRWELNGSAGRLSDTEVLNTTYFPGEESGNQDLLLRVKGQYGCPESTAHIQIAVRKAELPEFHIPETNCVENEVVITRLPEEQPVGGKAVWSVDGVEESREWSQLKKTFWEAGNYNIRLVSSDDGRCPRFMEKQLTVHDLPATDFISDPDSIAGAGQEVRFTNTTPGTVTYFWDFHGEGTEISDEGGVHIRRYDWSGVSSFFADVTLTVTDANGCQAARTHTLKVIGGPQAKFAITNFDPCTGEIGLENLSVGENLDFYWDLGNGYTSVDSVPINLVYPPVYKDSTYRITLQVTNKAGTSYFTEEVEVVSLLAPKYIISPDKDGCEGKQLSKGFANRTEGEADYYTFSWGDGSKDQVFSGFHPVPVYHLYSNSETKAKTYVVSLTASNKCHEEIYKDSVSILPNEISTDFTLSDTRICFGNEITFRNQSFGFAEDVQAWWYFGAATPSHNNSEEVIHRFDTPGDYPVRLVMSDRCNTDTSDIVQIKILGDKSLAFSVRPQPYCTGQGVEMKVLQELKERFIDFSWDFGDSQSRNGIDSVVKKYDLPGTYEVVLTAKSSSEGNCPVRTPGTMVKVNQTPQASIRVNGSLEGCHPHIVDQFARLGEGNERIFWDFRNNETATEAAVEQVLFREPGTYPVLLRLTSPEGCIDTAVKTVTVQESPQPVFEVSKYKFCSEDGNLTIGLENQTVTPDLFSYEWSYNGGAPFSRKEKPEALILSSMFGEIQIELLAIHNENGCTARVDRKVVSGHEVRLAIQADTVVCLGESLSLLNASEYGDRVRWTLGDGSVEERDTFSYVYDQPGVYNVKAVVLNDTGCKDSVEKVVSVYPLPVADFSYEYGAFIPEDLAPHVDIHKLSDVKNGSVRFINRSFVDHFDFADTQLKSFWDFGDGSESLSVDAPEHYFDNNGQYVVKLVVQTSYGCRDSITESVAVDAVKGLFIPNAFAPGAGAGENPGVALFQPKGVGLLSYQIKVYDQSGTCVWSSDKLVDGRPAEFWDGTFKGQPLPGKLYSWEANAIFIDGSVWSGEKGHKKGYVILIR